LIAPGAGGSGANATTTGQYTSDATYRYFKFIATGTIAF
jgi:hypothetical protein